MTSQWSYDPKRIGRRIRMFRRKEGMSQQNLGEKLGVSYQQVQKYESGKNRISAEKLILVAQVLDIPIHVLMGFQSDDALYPETLYAHPQTIRMLEYFNGIKDEVVRKRLTLLCEAISES